MRVLVIGTGGVGAAVAAVAQRRSFFERMVFADVDPERAKAVVAKTGEPDRFGAERVDASKAASVAALARKVKADVILNAVDPRFNPPIFAAAFEARCTYLDMAMTLSRPHPKRPYKEVGVKLGDKQFAEAERWEQAGLLALVGIGVEPGLSDVFARYAADHLFSEIDEVAVRDGANLVVEGYAFAPTFSIWTTIEECLNPPVIWERERGWYTTRPFSDPEVFEFPEGIGPVECVNVEHEEVLLVPRWVDCNRVTFKYGLGDEFINVLRTLHLVGLDSTKKVRVGDVEVAPRDVVAASLPNPAELGDRMTGKTCAGTYVTGTGKDGKPRAVYLYHVADNERTMREYGHQAVVLQTALNPVVALELLSTGAWKGAGVLGPEAFDAVPFLDLLAEYGEATGLDERGAAPPPPPPPPPPVVKPLVGAMVVTAGNIDPQLLRDAGVTHVAVELTDANIGDFATPRWSGFTRGGFVVSRGKPVVEAQVAAHQAAQLSLEFLVFDTESHKADMGGVMEWTETLYAEVRSTLGAAFPLFNVTFGIHSSPAVVNHEAFRKHDVVPIWEAYDGDGRTLGVQETVAKANGEGWVPVQVAVGDKSLSPDASVLHARAPGSVSGVWLWAPENGQAQEDLRAGAAAKLKAALG